LLIFDFAAWGWIWIVLGCVRIVASLGVLVGSRWARITGIVLSCLSMLGQLMFVSAFPFWSVVCIVLSLLVIYGLLSSPGAPLGGASRHPIPRRVRRSGSPV
jgi:hypothetical protein